MNQTDLLSLGFGLSLGIILGLVNFSLGNGAGISLGIAGGPLIVALLLGHFGRLGPIVGYIPRPTRLLLQDLGLVFFLADAGIKGGADLVDTVATHGAAVFIMGVIVTCSGMFAGYFVGMKVFKMNILECLGGICGGMTSTPAPGSHRQQDGLPGSRGQLRHRLSRSPYPDDYRRQGHHPDHRRRGGNLTMAEII